MIRLKFYRNDSSTYLDNENKLFVDTAEAVEEYFVVVAVVENHRFAEQKGLALLEEHFLEVVHHD
jgi:hypothetical protein